MTEHGSARWIEWAIVIVMILVVTVTGVQATITAQARRRDASQVEALRQAIAQIAEANARGQFVCSSKEMRTCQAGDALRSCAIFFESCEQRGSVARTTFEILSTTTHVTEWQDAAHFQIEFITEGTNVAGLEPGNAHLADQNGILR